jgi:hypothetical protein
MRHFLFPVHPILSGIFFPNFNSAARSRIWAYSLALAVLIPLVQSHGSGSDLSVKVAAAGIVTTVPAGDQ